MFLGGELGCPQGVGCTRGKNWGTHNGMRLWFRDPGQFGGVPNAFLRGSSIHTCPLPPLKVIRGTPKARPPVRSASSSPTSGMTCTSSTAA